jgi:hypothetical protein
VAGAVFLTMMIMGAHPTSNSTSTNPTKDLEIFYLFRGGGGWVGFEVGLELRGSGVLF